MSEHLQTRAEHSRSLEDAEMYRAIEDLKEVGLLVPVSDLETYHGRVGRAGEEPWAVDPSFANGGNASGNDNVNSRSSLYTGERGVAEDFARQRGRDMVRQRYDRLLEDRVRNYDPQQRAAMVDQANRQHYERYGNMTPEQRGMYRHLFDAAGRLKPVPFDNRMIWNEARRLDRTMPAEQKSSLWRTAGNDLRAEVHKITVADSDAMVINGSFKPSKLSPEDQATYSNALKALVRRTPMTEGSPVSFDDRSAVAPFVDTVRSARRNMFYVEEVRDVARQAGIREQTAMQLVSAYNAQKIAERGTEYLAAMLLSSKDDIAIDKIQIGGQERHFPLNMEYVERYMRNAHIVGVQQRVNSATLGRTITSVSFFDLEKATTQQSLETERAEVWQKLGGMATALSEAAGDELGNEHMPLVRLLTDAHAKPHKLVAAAQKVRGYDQVFAADAGNWEGFTLAEHTETVLRNFDENYADKLPVELLAPMRLAILTHDLGKPAAARERAKHNQKVYNAAYASDFMNKLGVDDKMQGLLLTVIGDGADLAFKIDVRKDGPQAQAAMRELAIRTLQDFNDDPDVPEDQIASFAEMCKILQTCDGGAYTSMAITRAGGSNGRYRNAPSFNKTFAQPAGLGKRAIRLRKANEPGATPDLTPQSLKSARH